MINNMINSIDSDTIMMLVNAVYFKARWLTDFDGSQTYARSVDRRQVPFMRSSDMQARYVAVDGVVMLQLKYRSDAHSMVIRMADDGVKHVCVDDIEKMINGDIMPSRIDLHMPKFQIDTKTGLNGYLQRLGVNSIFTPSTTGWQGITDSTEILVSSVLHQSKVNVDESGTEAVAVTAIIVGITAMQMDPPISVILEKPFSFSIYDSESKSVLFSGAIFN